MKIDFEPNLRLLKWSVNATFRRALANTSGAAPPYWPNGRNEFTSQRREEPRLVVALAVARVFWQLSTKVQRCGFCRAKNAALSCLARYS